MSAKKAQLDTSAIDPPGSNDANGVSILRNGFGEVSQRTYFPGGKALGYAYYPDGKVHYVTNQVARNSPGFTNYLQAFAYDRAGSVSSFHSYNLQSSFVYDRSGRLR